MTIKSKRIIRILSLTKLNLLNLILYIYIYIYINIYIIYIIYNIYIYVYIYIYICIKKLVKVSIFRNNRTRSYQKIIKVLKLNLWKNTTKLFLAVWWQIFFVSVDVFTFHCNYRYSCNTMHFIRNKKNCSCCSSCYTICCGGKR